MNQTTTRPAPGRVRPFAKTQAATPTLLKMFLGRDLAPTKAEYDRVCDALWDGDPAMDKLIDWMYKHGPRDARGLFEQALANGVDSIANCPEPLKVFFKGIDNPPYWVDHRLLGDAVRFIHGTGATSLYVMRDLALMGGYLLSGFNQTLILTGALNKGTSRRVAETGKWWMDCTEHNGMQRFADGFKSTLHVRMVHGLVRRSLASRDDWETEQWGTPLSQIDMVATYLGFSVVLLGGLRKMGIPVTKHESRAVMHLWSYACWLMGVDEKWLVRSERQAIVLLQHTIMTQSQPDWTTKELAVALSKEPLERSYPNLEELRRLWDYHMHLSTSQYFLGTEKMEQLGLSKNIFSWYPLLTTPPRFVQYSSQRLVPSLRKAQEQRGRQIQYDKLAALFGDQEHGIIKPGASHPGHV